MATLVNKGLESKARLLNGAGGGTPAVSAFEHMALGTGSTAEAVTDTALVSEITTNGGARESADTVAYEADYKATWINTWTFTGVLAIMEFGIFDGPTVGAANSNMLMRHVFAAAKNVISGDTLQITVKETESRV